MKRLREVVSESRLPTRLRTLIRAGLFDSKKIPTLRRALDKDPSKMTPQERDILKHLLDNVLDQVMNSQQVYQKIRQNVREDVIQEAIEGINIPAVLVLKRRAIRLYPDGQKVALYYASKIKKYVSVPFSGIGISEEKLNEVYDGLTVDYEKMYVQKG